MDVAIVPLEDSNFNRGKSSLKALEFSAMGVPVVATPTPANRLLAKDLPIILASTPDEWAHHVTRLLNDPTERAERSALAREVVREKWTVEGNAELWANAWERAIRRRARMVA
jgi:glycosyltransferase involved in cell wall biosynthesis